MRAKTILGATGLAVIGTGAYIAISATKRSQDKVRKSAERWHTVTVNLPLDEVAPGGDLPKPLEGIVDIAEVRLQPAPGDRGTEIGARLLQKPGELEAREALRKIRTALRSTEMLLETGEILSPDKRPSTRPSLFNAPLQYMSRHGFGEGRL